MQCNLSPARPSMKMVQHSRPTMPVKPRRLLKLSIFIPGTLPSIRSTLPLPQLRLNLIRLRTLHQLNVVNSGLNIRLNCCGEKHAFSLQPTPQLIKAPNEVQRVIGRIIWSPNQTDRNALRRMLKKLRLPQMRRICGGGIGNQKVHFDYRTTSNDAINSPKL